MYFFIFFHKYVTKEGKKQCDAAGGTEQVYNLGCTVLTMGVKGA